MIRMPAAAESTGPLMCQLIAVRVARQIPITEIAKKTGWTAAAVWHYENNKRRVPLAYFEAAAQVLGMKIEVTSGVR